MDVCLLLYSAPATHKTVNFNVGVGKVCMFFSIFAETFFMKTVTVKDKTFAISISEAEILARVDVLAAEMSRRLEGKHPIFLTVLNGAFVFAADLVRRMTIPCEISFVRMSSYSGTSSTGQVKELIGLKEDLEGRTVVVVEDIIDSGLTMKEMLGLLRKKHPAEVYVASLLVKPDNLKVEMEIDFHCFDIPNDFIVGYGLDYDGEGRNLRDIYTVVDEKGTSCRK